jgi:hypothetical protein
VALLATAVLSVLLHWTLGWEATVLAGLLGGAWAERAHWLVGGAGVALGWASFVVYTAAVSPAALRVLLDTLSSLAGNIPGEALVGLTVLLGGVLGCLGGAVGRLLRVMLMRSSQ